jgi:hypothetical protein
MPKVKVSIQTTLNVYPRRVPSFLDPTTPNPEGRRSARMAKKKEERQNQEVTAEERQANQARRGNPDEAQPQHFVEDDEGNRAMATPQEDVAYGADQPDQVHTLEAPVSTDVDIMAEHRRQQLQNYPRLPEEYFDPHNIDAEEKAARSGYAATARSSLGRWVVVDHDHKYEGEIIKGGVQELPTDVADALIADGVAFDPAGKQGGR